MTKRKHLETSVKCEGCGKLFGIIQQSHIDKCVSLKLLGILTRSDYKSRFGKTISDDAQNILKSNIEKYNKETPTEIISNNARVGGFLCKQKHPDLASKLGKVNSKKLWSIPNQKIKHAERLRKLNASGFMTQKTNKLENKFWNLIGKDKIEFASFKFWKTIKSNDYRGNITPDFIVPKTKKVIEVFGNYWHKKEEECKRVNAFKSVGLDCLIVWEKDINSNPDFVKKIVNHFISRNLQECPTPDSSYQGSDIV